MAIRNPSRQRLSLGEFLRRPETKPASELIDGEVVQKPVSKVPHSLAQMRLILALAGHSATSAGLALPEQGTNLGEDHRVPDVSWYAPGRLDEISDYPSFPPDLAAEIRSDGQSKDSQRRRLAYYRQQGTVATLLIDPADRTVEVTDGNRSYVSSGDDTVTLDSIGGFEFAVSALFTP